jgi:arylsulfatase A-like enzyme
MMRAFRSGNWKYIATLGDDGELLQQELYDLITDPSERRDRSAELSGELSRFHQLLEAHDQLAESLGGADQGVEIDPATQKLLESLGYVSH